MSLLWLLFLSFLELVAMMLRRQHLVTSYVYVLLYLWLWPTTELCVQYKANTTFVLSFQVVHTVILVTMHGILYVYAIPCLRLLPTTEL